jgi:AcrR family transcriptional regulator
MTSTRPDADTTERPCDHRTRSRRRGETLNSAIFAATIAELTELGYAELTMKGIALRARASKGSLYRRWPSLADLVVDAISYGTFGDEGPPMELPETGTVRGDVLGFMRKFAAKLNGPSGEAIRGLMTEILRDPDLMRVIHNRFIEPVTDFMLEALRRGVVRGEVRPTALTPRVATVGPDLLRHHVLLHGTPVEDAVLVEIVDEVVMPLVRR